MACHVIHADWCVRRNAQRNFLNIALPTLGRVFSVGTGTLQWLVTGYMLMIGIVLPFSSLISKWFSTRQIIIFALADFTVGALISGFANSFGMLLFGRMIQESAPD